MLFGYFIGTNRTIETRFDCFVGKTYRIYVVFSRQIELFFAIFKTILSILYSIHNY